jgi:hypothetical protein
MSLEVKSQIDYWFVSTFVLYILCLLILFFHYKYNVPTVPWELTAKVKRSIQPISLLNTTKLFRYTSS